MTKDSRQELLLALRPQYLKANKAEKGLILDQFVAATGYHRKYAIHLFQHGLPRAPRKSRKRQVVYGPDVIWALVKILESLRLYLCPATATLLARDDRGAGMHR